MLLGFKLRNIVTFEGCVCHEQGTANCHSQYNTCRCSPYHNHTCHAENLVLKERCRGETKDSLYQQHPFEHISYIFPVDTLQMSVSVFMRMTLVASPTHQRASARTAGQGGSAPQVNEQLSLKHRTIGNWIKRHFSCLLSSPISLMFLQFVNMDLT